MLKNAFILFTVAFVVLAVFLPQFSRVQDIRERDREHQQRITDLIKENERLAEEQRRLEDDPEYLEKVAREKMGLIREGEVVYKLMPMNAAE
jgi:cell division protein FtsB